MRRVKVDIINIALALVLVGILIGIFLFLFGTYPTVLFPRVQLQWAKERWAAAEIKDYRMKVRVMIPFAYCHYTITVKDGLFANSERDDTSCADLMFDTGNADRSNLPDGRDLTVKGLFLLAESHEIAGVWFSSSGYITQLDIYNSPSCGLGCAMGESIDRYRVTDFEILQPSDP